MKHRLQGDKKTLCLLYDTPRQAASDERRPGLIPAQLWARPRLAGGVLCFWDKLICSAIPESIGTGYQHQKCSALAENPA